MYTGGYAEGDIQRGMYREGYTEGVLQRGGIQEGGMQGRRSRGGGGGDGQGNKSYNLSQCCCFYTLQHNVSAKTILCEGQVPAITP